MYKIINLLLVVVLSSSLAFSQGHKEKMSPEAREKLESQKISYITQQVDITPEQAQVFWPLYNELTKKKRAFHHEFRQLLDKLKDEAENLPEEELVKISDRTADLKVERAKMEREYYYKFKEVLSTKQLLNLNLAEKQFQNMLFRRIKGEGDRGNRRD